MDHTNQNKRPIGQNSSELDSKHSSKKHKLESGLDDDYYGEFRPLNPSEISPQEDEDEENAHIDLGTPLIPPRYDSGSYMGPSHGEEPYFIPFLDKKPDGTIPFVTRGVRIVNDNVSFAVYSHSCECDSIIMSAYNTKWKQLSKTIEPFKDQLLALYLRFVDWTYPAVDKKRFYKAYTHNDPPLHRGVLCAMLALGTTYWKYSAKLCVQRIPYNLAKDLWSMCLHYIEHDTNCTGASLETIRAALLYTQKRIIGDGIHEQITGRLHIGTIVSMAYSLGLHLDCSDWDISDIEKVSRRRLWALVFYGDKWSAATLGQPSLLTQENYGSQGDHVFESQWPKERPFVQLIKLTNILSRVLSDLYGNGNTPRLSSVKKTVDREILVSKAQRLLEDLRKWKENLPDDMREMSTRNDLKYCSNGMIHMNALTIQALIYRILLHPCFNGRYRHEAKELVQQIIIFTFEITHAHLYAFWLSNCRLSLSTLVHFVLRYHAQTPINERKKNTSHMRSWLECLRSLSHAWEEGVGLAFHRVDSLFYKGQTKLSLPLIEEILPEELIGEASTELPTNTFDNNANVSQEEELLALDEDFNFENNTPDGMLFFNDDLHDILHDILWD